jgi:hypothetical protein
MIDVKHTLYYVLPRYFYDPRIEWPVVSNETVSGLERHTFDGSENWQAF